MFDDVLHIELWFG